MLFHYFPGVSPVDDDRADTCNASILYSLSISGDERFESEESEKSWETLFSFLFVAWKDSHQRRKGRSLLGAREFYFQILVDFIWIFCCFLVSLQKHVQRENQISEGMS